MLNEQIPTLDQFEALARNRRATRHFISDPVPPELIERLIDIARWAPSGYNLQPTHIVVVTDNRLKKELYHACLDQAQILEAPAILIFTGDRRVIKNNFESMLSMELEAKTINPEYERRLRFIVPLFLSNAPFGIGWLWKALFMPFLRLVRPVPRMPVIFKREWLTKQVMLVAMNFMLAAASAGLATVPMEGFDEGRIRRLLKIPRSYVIPVVIPLGYAVEGKLKKTRLPNRNFIHLNGW
jgi:nitroreductase